MDAHIITALCIVAYIAAASICGALLQEIER